MSMGTAFQAQIGAIVLLAIVSSLMIALQIERLDAYRRPIALWSIGVFCLGAATIWSLEEIKAYFWERPAVSQHARRAPSGAEWDGGGHGRRAGTDRGGRDGGAETDLTGHEADGTENDADRGIKRATYPANIRNLRFQECDDCPEMVMIPAGHDGAPIPRFALGRFEVTLREYHAFIVQSGHRSSQTCDGIIAAGSQPAYLVDDLTNAASRPALCLSWRDAQAYATWLSAKTGQPYRLPTAREWHHAGQDRGAPVAAARASAALLPGTSALVQSVRLDLRQGATTPAAALSIAASASNDFGVFDMAGNVSEWSFGCAQPTTASPADARDATRGCARQALGGSWALGEGLDRQRAADPRTASPAIGVRIVRDLPQP